MFDFDLAAIGFEYVGILHGHRFKLGDTGEIIYCFSMDTSFLLGQQLAKHTKRHFHRLLLQTRSRTESSLADGAKNAAPWRSEWLYEQPGLAQTADI